MLGRKNKAASILFICLAWGWGDLCSSSLLVLRNYSLHSLVFKTASSSLIHCSLLGVKFPSSHACGNLRLQQYYARGFLDNHLSKGQLYEVHLNGGLCIVYSANVSINEEVVASGFAVINKNNVNNVLFLDTLKELEDIARINKRGLWADFFDEMRCLQNY